jgi:hypothetical protein
LVEAHQTEIEKILEENREEIEAGRLVVYMIDECHLLWGDVCGYVWGKTKIRVEVPMTNQRERQTYFGALNYQTKQFFVQIWSRKFRKYSFVCKIPSKSKQRSENFDILGWGKLS